MRTLTFLLLAVVFSCGCFHQSKPNILFILTDDQALWTVSAYGNSQNNTPYMDQLASEGAMLLNSFTVTPVCSPSRASLLTSRYGHQLGITDWINPNGKNSLKGGEASLGLDTSMITWPELFQAKGYKTGLVGKWHLGELDQYYPNNQGYSYFSGFRGGGTKTKDPVLEIDKNERQFKGLTTDILTDLAIYFIKENYQAPFCLSLHFRAPHTAWLPVAPVDMEPFIEKTPDLPNPDYPDLDIERLHKMMPEYLASVRGVDRNLGKILKVLDSLEISDNTIVVFTSDHGYNMGHNGIWHKGNGHWILNHPNEARKNIPINQRPNMYDNSIRVPAIIRWPGKIESGMVVKETVSNLDWYPSLLSLAGINLPDQIKIYGKDIKPILMKEPIPWENDFYAEYSTHHQSMTHMRMYRTKRWKLVRDLLNPWRDEFYDIQNDPAETVNLINDPSPEIQNAIHELHKKIVEKMRKLDDPVLELIDSNCCPT